MPPDATGTPISQRWYAGTLEVNIATSAWTLRLIDTYTSIMWINSTESGIWKGWIPLATATKPAVYDLPLAAGITPYLPCKYWKTQDNEVKTLIRVSFTTFSNPLPVATLPEGYRPRHAITVLSQIYSQSGATQAHADLSQSGDIWLYQDGAASGNGSAIIEPFCFVSA